MKNFKYEGHTVPFTAAATHASGSVHVINELAGAVAYDVVSGEEGQLNLTGVIEVAKEATTVTFAQGEAVYWDVADQECNDDSVNNPLLGYAYAAVIATDAKVLVMLKYGAK